MKITSYGVNAADLYNKQQKALSTSKSKMAFSSDRIEISHAAKEMSISSTYNSERAQKLQQIKEQIQSGEYKVDARKVAEDLLNYYGK